MEMNYADYLEELYRLIRLRYEYAALRLDARENESRDSERQQKEQDCLEAVRAGAQSVLDAEEALLAGETFAPLPYLLAVCECSEFERHAAAMLLFWELRPECADANAALCGTGEVTPRLLALTFCGEVTDDEACLSLREDSVFGSVFLEPSGGRGMDRMLVLAPGILRMILTGVPENRPNEAAMAARGLALVGSPIPRAQRVECHFSLEDVVLPVDSKEALRIACDRVRNAKKVYEQWGMGRLVTYGKGVSLLFSGPPGTGKTMAAQAVAAELAMELYRINLPAVVSKYIGETERNLSEIFENARGRNVVLFFDEADVLFGKRTEIKDSNDKYSNMEAAYLLQRIEEYEGVVVMATNYRRNFDEAFNRRLTAVIDFPFPDEEARKEIWKRSIPAVLFDDSIDTDALAGQYELSGSAIKNSVLYAAFLAASRGEETLSEKLIFEGIREEFKKQGKVIGRKERE